MSMEHGCVSFEALQTLYPEAPNEAAQRYAAARDAFFHCFPAYDTATFLSAGGRVELGGNHTDHQNGRVLAAAITKDALGVAARNNSRRVNVYSEGFPPYSVELDRPLPNDASANCRLLYGVAEGLRRAGLPVDGFDLYAESRVRVGSGLSSSAAFETLLGTVFTQLLGIEASPLTLAKVGQYAETRYFGKPCGLMDQAACALGGCAALDFIDPAAPLVRRVPFDPTAAGLTACVVHCGGDHAELTSCYAAIVDEMGQVARCFGKSKLSELDKGRFLAELPRLTGRVPARALLRALHFFNETERVPAQCAALETGDWPRFLTLVNESGTSSFELLQNVCPDNGPDRSLALALALSKEVLDGEGACRVHGGGFMGTILAFVPTERMPLYRSKLDGVFGAGAVNPIFIRPCGGVRVGDCKK